MLETFWPIVEALCCIKVADFGCCNRVLWHALVTDFAGKHFGHIDSQLWDCLLYATEQGFIECVCQELGFVESAPQDNVLLCCVMEHIFIKCTR